MTIIETNYKIPKRYHVTHLLRFDGCSVSVATRNGKMLLTDPDKTGCTEKQLQGVFYWVNDAMVQIQRECKPKRKKIK